MVDSKQLRYISGAIAQDIDTEMMGPEGGFALEQLMELAALSVAEALFAISPIGPKLPLDSNGIKQRRTNERVLIICGPGNQGGDGLIAARHLYNYGYAPSIFYPVQGKNPHYARLKLQCENLELPFIAPPPSTDSSFPAAPDAQLVAFKRALSTADVVLDCLFGFSYKPPSRAPFTSFLAAMKETTTPIVAVDIPSGWDVSAGNIDDQYEPSALISMTAPKLGVKNWVEAGGIHYLGARFTGHVIEAKYQLNLPEFPGRSQCVDITRR